MIVYELVGIAFLLRYFRGGVSFAASSGGSGRFGWLWLSAAGLFAVFSLLTKQDGGGIAFFLSVGLLVVACWLGGSWKPLLIFTGSYIFFLAVSIGPFLSHGFGYWFNHGQAPHSSRVSSFDIAAEFFGASQWLKFYFFLSVLLVVVRYRKIADLKADPKGVLLVVLCWGILGEASVLQVTSYTPPDNNIFFHSFAFPCLLSLLVYLLPSGWERPRVVWVLVAGVVLWWSGVWWKYTQRLTGPFLTRSSNISPTGENVVSKDNYILRKDSAVDIPTEQWVDCGLRTFHKITVPAPTADGIHRLMNLDLIKKYQQGRRPGDPPGDLRVLNMSELTPLAEEIPFALEKNPRLPLWYHLGVGMFNQQADSFETRIGRHYYDLVLFEYIPGLNNFYPFRVHDSLRLHYSQVDSFMAPRRGPESQGVIEVFLRPADSR